MEDEKLVHYACVSSPSLKGESLKKRAMAGESLDTELKELATSYTKKETCGKELLSLNAGHCKSSMFKIAMNCHLTTFAIFDIFYSLR